MAVHLVKLACEMPDKLGCSLALWDCRELANQLVRDGVVTSISPDTVRRILLHHRLKPWRHPMWLGAKTPRDDAFRQTIAHIIDLYTRPLLPGEMVVSFDEKTHLTPRGRKAATKPPKPDSPALVEHEYRRCGSSNLLAAFDTRTGRVYGRCYRRKRSAEFIDFLEYLNSAIPGDITLIHVVLDNLRVHKSKAVLAWLVQHPRFRFHFTPVHCSWMNQVEPWFGTLQRKRFRVSEFESIEEMEAKILQYIALYNEHAHPYNWSTKSVARVMALPDEEARVA